MVKLFTNSGATNIASSRSEPSAIAQFLSGKGIDLQNLCRIEALPIT